MSSRTGKHFRNEKDLIIHDKTGRVSYYLGILFAGSFLVPSVTPRDSFKRLVVCLSLNLQLLCQSLPFTRICIFLFADFDILESLCKIS